MSCIVSDLLEQVNKYLARKIGGSLFVITEPNDIGADTDIDNNNSWDDARAVVL